MKTSAKISNENGIVDIKFDIFEAVWGYWLSDNLSLLADSRNNSLRLLSFIDGKEKTLADISKDNLDILAKSDIYKLNYLLGDDYSVIYKKEPIDVTGKFIEAIEAQSKGRNKTAIECYQEVLQANPNNYRAQGLLGRCLRIEGRIDEAQEAYNKAVELAPNSPEAYCNLGILFQKNNNENKAQEYFLKAIEVDNFYCNALVKRATWLLNNDRNNAEIFIYNLRLSAVYQDVVAAQNYLKKYYEEKGYDRNSYSDEETSIFGDFADYKLQKKLKLIESSISNGAYGIAFRYIKEVLELKLDNSSKKIIDSWCNAKSRRCVNDLQNFNDNNLSDIFDKLLNKASESHNDELLEFVKPIVAKHCSERTINPKEDIKKEEIVTIEDEKVEKTTLPEQNLSTVKNEAVESPKTIVKQEDSSETTENVKKLDTKGVSLNNNYKSPIKGVDPLTIQEFFMIVLFEVMRSGDIDESEKRFLSELKKQLNISGKDYSKMYSHIQEQININGVDKPKEEKFNPQRIFRNLCKAAWRDGVLADSEKKLLLYACKIFKITEEEFKEILVDTRNQRLEKNKT